MNNQSIRTKNESVLWARKQLNSKQWESIWYDEWWNKSVGSDRPIPIPWKRWLILAGAKQWMWVISWYKGPHSCAQSHELNLLAAFTVFARPCLLGSVCLSTLSFCSGESEAVSSHSRLGLALIAWICANVHSHTHAFVCVAFVTRARAISACAHEPFQEFVL